MSEETSSSPPSSIYLPPGTLVGEFRVEQLLGEGGMATVYAATHTVIGKKAAVKVMSHRLCADPGAVERFVSEARAVNQIGHPNIVDAFAFGKLEDGRSYMVMEWLQGMTLQQRLEEGSLPFVDSLDLLIQICDALEAAHEKGIIHRDLKPDNIFLTTVRGRRTVVKLLDFGIAKLTSTELTQTKTKTGLFVGTPTHISPEQARAKNVDARTDIYALGVTAYQMLLGRLPFDADNAIDLVTLHLVEPPPLPRSIWPEVPEAIEMLLLSLLEKDMEKRPSLHEVGQLLIGLREEYRGPSVGTTDPSGQFPVTLAGRTTPIPSMARGGTGESRAITGVGGRRSTPTPSGVSIRRTPTGPTPITNLSGTNRRSSGVHALAQTTPAGTPVLDETGENADPPPPTSHTNSAPALDAIAKKPQRALLIAALALLIAVVLGLGIGLGMHRAAPPPVVAVKPPVVLEAPKPVPEPVKAEPAAPLPAQLKLEINVPALVEIDGAKVADNVQEATLPIDRPGAHELTVTAAKRKPYHTNLNTSAGEKLQLVVNLDQLAPTAAEKKADKKSAKPGGAHGREYMLDPFAEKKK